MNLIFESPVIWSYENEVLGKDGISQIAAQFSGVAPIHNHEGSLTLTTSLIQIMGDEELNLPLSDIEQLYIGFDEVYHRNFVKNFGAFCQPLRITFSNVLTAGSIYIIADYRYGTCTATQQLFTVLQELLS